MWSLVVGALAFRAPPPVCSIAVFGGTGGTGSEVVYQALERDERVVTLARNPGKMRVPVGSGGRRAGQRLRHEALKVMKGRVDHKPDVDRVFREHNITSVVIALGSTSKYPTLLHDATANIVRNMKEHDVKRVSVVTTIGAGDSIHQAPWTFRMLMMTALAVVMVDKNEQEAIFLDGEGSDLEYTIIRPGGLKYAPPTGKIDVITDEAKFIARADVATFCLDAVLDPDFPHLRQTPCISSTEKL